jgi:hypothetical protein
MAAVADLANTTPQGPVALIDDIRADAQAPLSNLERLRATFDEGTT